MPRGPTSSGRLGLRQRTLVELCAKHHDIDLVSEAINRFLSDYTRITGRTAPRLPDHNGRNSLSGVVADCRMDD
jgi:hypothetical protein